MAADAALLGHDQRLFHAARGQPGEQAQHDTGSVIDHQIAGMADNPPDVTGRDYEVER